MNRTEKIICAILGAILVVYFIAEMKGSSAKQREAARQAVEAQAAAAQQAQTAQAIQRQAAAPAPVQAAPAPAQPAKPEAPALPEEKFVTLENDELCLRLTTWGGAVKSATLKKYAKDKGEISEANPAVEFDFGGAPLGLSGTVSAFEVESATSSEVVFTSGARRRKVTLGDNYRIEFEDSGLDGETTLSVGSMSMGASKSDILSVDSWAMDAGKGKEGVVHHSEGDSPIKPYLHGSAGGCSKAQSSAGLPLVRSGIECPGAVKWVALKNRFFVTALVSTTAENTGFAASVARDAKSPTYRPESVSATLSIKPAADGSAKSVFYVGPKKQSLLWGLGMKDVMEFGMWRWICYPVVWVLDFFHSLIPNYGIAIILMTILVRLLFWPLTHKSTVGMRRMQEIQPLMKEIQAKFKDNPQRMQQETFRLYREHKVNPLSSCLPMLVQIPVFIALFNVLRAAVELRYAPFLWISDLSEPEALFASWFPFGGLNILPILMAVTTGLQSALTPSTGDKQQQKMMMFMMPAMMLFMFYNFASALSLYWTVSQGLSIFQMWLIRRSVAKKESESTSMGTIIDPPSTRQMKRHA
ncbi:MAG: membrane protein insertase YidC [Lentisphaerae bacterium]|nr:membrane protein insertase YidC [Lentisphaerota bacterium]